MATQTIYGTLPPGVKQPNSNAEEWASYDTMYFAKPNTNYTTTTKSVFNPLINTTDAGIGFGLGSENGVGFGVNPDGITTPVGTTVTTATMSGYTLNPNFAASAVQMPGVAAVSYKMKINYKKANSNGTDTTQWSPTGRDPHIFDVELTLRNFGGANYGLDDFYFFLNEIDLIGPPGSTRLPWQVSHPLINKMGVQIIICDELQISAPKSSKLTRVKMTFHEYPLNIAPVAAGQTATDGATLGTPGIGIAPPTTPPA
jgi:hypothetical protein